uniref:RNase H type-1 domain-containing protein n=1 Tax=Picea sitchensis TaxID=3332 RepID=D5A901_PICSI|nr:unknown [Picea sitchensis]
MQKLHKGGRGPVTGAASFRSPPCKLYFDGACRGNPGTAGIGFLLKDSNGEVVERFCSLLGYKLTNNVAEYKALIAGLQHALDHGITSIQAYGDSELICKQVNGQYRVANRRLARYYNTVCQLLGKFESHEVLHVPRDENCAADDLANDGIDRPVVDTSSAAQLRVIQRCRTPEGAKKFILEKRSEGILQLRFILDTIQFALPKSYDAVQELSSNVLHDMDMCPDCQDDSQHYICMSCLLAQS